MTWTLKSNISAPLAAAACPVVGARWAIRVEQPVLWAAITHQGW
jgi:hypothetical protein